MNRPAPHNMYYVAIVCPTDINEKVQQYKQWMKDRFGCLVAMKSPAHITLIPPFWFADDREIELMKAVQSFINDSPIQKIELDGFSHFGKRVLYVHTKDNYLLSEIKRRAEQHFIEKIGNAIKKDDRPFHPHITIANRDLKPSDFEKAWDHFSTKEFKESFITQAIFLLRLSPGKWNVICESPRSPLIK